MAGPLTFVRPLPWGAVRDVLLVQSGPIEIALAAADRLRTLFPGCRLEAVIREADVEAASGADFDRIHVAQWKDRAGLVRALRVTRRDLVVCLLSNHENRVLRLLPLRLRTRSMLAFNDHLDHFPVSLARLRTLTYHLTGQRDLGAVTAWLAARAVMVPCATVFLMAVTGRRYAHAWARRWTR